MDNKKQFFRNVDELLQNDDFIKWRLFQTKVLDEYWANFIIENPHLEKVLQEAIYQFGDVKINYFPINDIEKKNLYRKIKSNIIKQKKHKWIIRFSFAAAVILFGIFSILFLKYTQINVEQDSYVNFNRIVGLTLPEDEIYLLSNGEKIKLADNSHIELNNDGKAVIIDSSQTKKELLLATSKLNRLVVPYGKRTNITLSDGTNVWLNSGTQLDFPSEFRGKTREIFVNGEIYVDVEKDINLPFIVHAGNMDVIVLGTAFNITAYKEDISKTVVLVNGEVKIEAENSFNTLLAPNEKVEVTDNYITKEFVNVKEYISWKDGLLELNSTPVTEILKRIGRYYNVQFEEAEGVDLSDKDFSGKLFLSNSLDSIMTSITSISSTDYIRNGNIIFLTKKELPMKQYLNSN